LDVYGNVSITYYHKLKLQFSSVQFSVACVTYLYSHVIRKRKKNRKFWVHPLLSDRFINDLRKYEDKLFNYLRMSVDSFDELMEPASRRFKQTNKYERMYFTGRKISRNFKVKYNFG